MGTLISGKLQGVNDARVDSVGESYLDGIKMVSNAVNLDLRHSVPQLYPCRLTVEPRAAAAEAWA